MIPAFLPSHFSLTLSPLRRDADDAATPAPEFDTILARLQNCVSRELVDTLALDFCYVNGKNTRKRLVKALMHISQSQQGLDVIPYFSRLVSTLNLCIPEIGALVFDAVRSYY